MAKRKQISKKTRFEIFKRDSFTCQYCGQMAPDVVLEIDHITPVAKGGANDLLNLVTSCKDCNRGKGKTTISDNSALKTQQKQLKELAEKREQIEMMMEWKKELLELENDLVEEINSLFLEYTSEQCSVSDYGKKLLRNWIKTFGFDLVYESTILSLGKYLEKDEETEKYSSSSVQKAFNYISGICKNKIEEQTNAYLKEINYILRVLANRFGLNGNLYKDDYWQCKKLVKAGTKSIEDFEYIKDAASSCYNIYDFIRRIEEWLDGDL